MNDDLPSEIERIRKVSQDADCLATEQEVAAAFDTMAQAITQRLKDKLPVVYCVMNGGMFTTSELLKRLDFPLEVDYLHATRYRRKTEAGDLHWRVEPEVAMKGRSVLVIDDILDEGATLAAILDHCREQGAKEVTCAVLVDKKHNRKAVEGFSADFTGLEVEDRYLFGCGMDYQGYLRNLPAIYAPQGL
ncbi:hypoxanthine-guanine phosphoribosyltransferase [Marinospirillum insulare]|uniref:Hypoxanthine-guanine phosphoribosyltransferase n=1 Tax=Marinospirillum insulare TaxID=217169 RepID=A0ABQ5ZYY1_9GAMM|nr:hypoxanthine-guanine phosphoribosyltransferase [Marinospirillum insulare]GLR64706.1 hypoxanthine-guanine phosphoribosyltransferase [Marinospirillum insulare]